MDIEFKEVNAYTWVYDDDGTGADDDVSIWRPYTNEAGYCALGDVTHASHSSLSISSFMVKELQAGALAHPTGFAEVGGGVWWCSGF